MEPVTMMLAASTALQFIGGMSQASAMEEAAALNAENARRIAAANKQQADYAAGQERAAAQRDAERLRHERDLKASQLAALGAASGTTIDSSLMAGILARGEYNADMVLANAEERAKTMEYRGTVGVAETTARNEANLFDAENRASAARITAFGSLVKGGAGIFGRFSPTDTPPGFQGDGMGWYD